MEARHNFEAINIGCGDVKIPGAIGVDRNPESKADVIHDLDIHPWPFPDNAFSKVICSHVLEHVQDPKKALEEIHRICKPGAVVEIYTPHYSSLDSWNDVTHRYHFGLSAFQPFYENKGKTPLFRLLRKQLLFGKGFLSSIGRLLAFLARLDFYEKHLCFLFPARNMIFILEAQKPDTPSDSAKK